LFQSLANNRVESADDSGRVDGIIAKHGMRAFLVQFQPGPANTQNAAQTLLDDPRVSSGAMTLDDVRAIAADNGYSATTRAAARYLTDHPSEFKAVEGADDAATTDGIISKNGMQAYLTQAETSAGGDDDLSQIEYMLEMLMLSEAGMGVGGLGGLGGSGWARWADRAGWPESRRA
jgi:hypothetical protein